MSFCELRHSIMLDYLFSISIISNYQWVLTHHSNLLSGEDNENIH